MTFSMTQRLGLIAVFLTTVTACSQKPDSDALRQQLRSFSVGLAELSENQVYLNDVSESAGQPLVGSLDLAATADDIAVNAVTQPRRLEQMVTQVLEQLDSNGSNSLSQTEFLLIKNIRIGNNVSANLTKVDAALTATFQQFAGADNLLSDAELSTLLAAQSGRIASFRRTRRPNQNANRARAAQDLLARFDANGDGIIDLAELQVLRDTLAGNNNQNNQPPAAVDPVVAPPPPEAPEVVVEAPAQEAPAVELPAPPPPVLGGNAGGNGAQCVGGPAFDPAGTKNVGNGQGIQFIGGQCTSSADCASGCCALPCGICSGVGAQFQAGKLGCGFGD